MSKASFRSDDPTAVSSNQLTLWGPAPAQPQVPYYDGVQVGVIGGVVEAIDAADAAGDIVNAAISGGCCDIS